MRILLVTGLVAGGVGRHVEQLSAGLRRRGHQVVVACPPAVADRFDLGATVVQVPVGERPDPARDRRAVRTLRRVMPGADVVHAHGLRAGALSVIARALPMPRSTRPRLVVTTHNAPPEGTLSRAVYAAMEQLVSRGADLVLGVSPDLVARAADAGARHPGLAVVPAASRAAVGDPQATGARVRHELGLGEGGAPLLVVSAGRLAPQKGQRELVEAYAQLLHAWPDDTPPVLVVAGEGPERAALEAQVAALPDGAQVRFLGHRHDVPDLLAAADLVVSSARWEGQPVWLQEALQVGAPIVATDVGGTGVVLGDGAVLVSPGPGLPGRLARAMGEVLLDPTRGAHLRRQAIVRAGELPGTEDAVEAALAAYLRVVGEPAVPPADPVT